VSGHDKPPRDSPALGTEDRPAAGLRQASLIDLIAQFALGMGVNLYVTLPPAGTPGRGNQPFKNGPVLAIHSVLGVLLAIAAIYLLVIAIIARDVPVIVTSAVGLAAIVTAAVMGFSFARNVATGNPMGWPRPPRSSWPAIP